MAVDRLPVIARIAIRRCPDCGGVEDSTFGICHSERHRLSGEPDRTEYVRADVHAGAVDALREYKAALEWYADPMQTRAAFTADGGVRARAVLKRVTDDVGGQS